MPLTRRVLLAALPLGVVGCATSPVVEGGPAEPPAPPEPTTPVQDPQIATAVAAVARLRAVLEPLTAAAGEHQAWAVAAVAQCDAHLARMNVPDLLSAEEQEPFDLPTPTPGTLPSTFDDAVVTEIGAARQVLSETATAQSDADLRLLFASAATATHGLRNPASAPTSGDGVPQQLQVTTKAASLPITLGHAWALVYGYGVGIGRLDRKDPLRAHGTARLAAVKELRNELRANLTGEVPEQPAAFELPTAMSDVDSIREGWAVLEMNLLDGYARLVSADADVVWRQRMLEQVAAVQSVGGALPHWPGWVA